MALLVGDANFALRWLRAIASKFNIFPRIVGAFGPSSGGHLVSLNTMRPSDPRYTALPRQQLVWISALIGDETVKCS